VIETDAVVIGAGPVGLFQVFELGLQEIGAQVVDSLSFVGGQCAELYPDKPIYDIPAVAVCTGRELADRLMQQLAPFKPAFHLGQQVSGLMRRDDGRFELETNRGTRFLTRLVLIAAGAGAFLPRKLKLDGLARFEGSQLHYHVADVEALAGQQVIVVGGDERAVDTAVRIATGNAAAAQVTLVHRRDHFDGPEALLARLRGLRQSGAVKVIAGQPTAFDEADGRLASVTITDNDDVAHTVPADALLVCLGLSPKLGPISDWGLAIERKQLVVDTASFQTSVPGLFAVGDINTYPGKRKLIVSGFHEATLAAFAAAAHLRPEKPVQLQYTTTSPRLHALLGVPTPVKA